MVGAAVGFQTRAFVTFGDVIPTGGLNTGSRRDMLKLAKDTLEIIGRLHKVLPTALVAAAMRPSLSRRDLAAAVRALVEIAAMRGANLDTSEPGAVLDEGVALLEARGIIVSERGRLRVRDRHALRYYARTVEHVLSPPKRAARTH
jgi:hypothetical protein